MPRKKAGEGSEEPEQEKPKKPKVPRATKRAQVKRYRKKKQREKKQGVARREDMCSWLTVENRPCLMRVSHRDDNGMFCETHRKKYYDLGLAEEMEQEVAQYELDQKIIKSGKKLEPRMVILEKTDEMARKMLEEAQVEYTDAELELAETTASPQEIARKIRFRKRAEEGGLAIDGGPRGLKHGGRGKLGHAYGGLDIDYYTPDYKNDHIFLLDQQIKRVHATLNMLFHQLQRIEEEEDKIKMTETEGTQIVDGAPLAFSQVQRKHVVPFELKMKLVDTIQKTEANYRSLLKQKEELLVTCLNILRKIGVKWSREAGMMVVEAIETKRLEQLVDHGAVDVTVSQPKEAAEEEEGVSEDEW